MNKLPKDGRKNYPEITKLEFFLELTEEWVYLVFSLGRKETKFKGHQVYVLQFFSP